MDEKIFEVEISNTGPKSFETATVLAMPCTQAEYRDALQKARIEDDRLCHNELTQINYPGITMGMIGQDVDLLELNLLSLRLTMLSDEDRMGLDGLLRMEQKQHPGPTVPHRGGGGQSPGKCVAPHPLPAAGGRGPAGVRQRRAVEGTPHRLCHGDGSGHENSLGSVPVVRRLPR